MSDIIKSGGLSFSFLEDEIKRLDKINGSLDSIEQKLLEKLEEGNLSKTELVTIHEILIRGKETSHKFLISVMEILSRNNIVEKIFGSEKQKQLAEASSDTDVSMKLIKEMLKEEALEKFYSNKEKDLDLNSDSNE